MSKQPRSLKKNAAYAAVTNLGGMLMVVLMVVAGRWLGKYDFGVLNFLLAVAVLFMSLSSFGVNSIAIRDVARDRSQARRYLVNVLAWRVLLSCLAVGGVLLTVGLSPDSTHQDVVLAALIGVAVTLQYLSLSGRSFLQAVDRFDADMRTSLIEQTALVGSGLAVLLMGGGLFGLALTFLVCRLLGALLTLAALAGAIGFVSRLEPRIILGLQWKALPIGLAMLVGSAYLHTDTLILSALLTFDDVGLYNSAFKVYASLMIMPGVICSVLLPRLSASFREDKQTHNQLVVKGVLMTALAALPVVVTGVLFGPWALTVVFGEQYAGAGHAMRVLLLSILPAFQVWLLRVLLVAVDRQVALLWVNLAGLATRIALNVLLLPVLGIVGAAMACLLSETVILAAGWYYLSKKHFRVLGFADLVTKVKWVMLREPAGAPYGDA